MHYALILAEGAAAPQTPTDGQGGGSSWTLLVMMGLIFAVFYFLLIRPQRQKEKDRQRTREGMLKNLKKSDHVLTIGGMHGIVAGVTESEVVLKVDEKNDVRVRFSRDAISRVVTEEDAKGEEGRKLSESPQENK